MAIISRWLHSMELVRRTMQYMFLMIRIGIAKEELADFD